MNLVGLADTRKVRKCVMVRTAKDAVDNLRQKMAVTAGGDHGAFSIWDDRFGRYRCQAYRHLVTVEDQMFTTLKDVRKWAVVWLKRIDEVPR